MPVQVLLGAEGERQWSLVEASYRLEGRLGVTVLLSGSAPAREECRLRLAALAPELRVVLPSLRVAEEVRTLAAAHRGGPLPSVAGGLCVLGAGAAYDAHAEFPLGVTLARLDPGADRLEARFLTWDARAADLTWGRVRFVGLPDKSPKPQTTVSDLFVPLALEVGEIEAPQTCEQIEAALLAPGAGPAARYAVLGDPGSGKTTLVRWLCARAAARAEAGEPFRAPLLLVVLRGYVRQDRRDGLLAFAAHEIRTQLSIPLDEAALAALCHAGQALLLVDGLEEVAVPADRERVRDMLASLAREQPALPVLGTSRIVGYDAAPLPRDAFRHRRLLPFTDAQLTEFVRRWYAAALPDDACLRERRQAELSAALETEPSARELARNPLFATLIALVHHFEARLPGERARLYELCVQMLLETWPKAAGREFGPLDSGRQRDVLQRLALRMQEGRECGGQSMAIARDELERMLCELLRARFAAGACDAEVQSLARAWVAWMAAGTGMLVEQQPGCLRLPAPLRHGVSGRPRPAGARGCRGRRADRGLRGATPPRATLARDPAADAGLRGHPPRAGGRGGGAAAARGRAHRLGDRHLRAGPAAGGGGSLAGPARVRAGGGGGGGGCGAGAMARGPASCLATCCASASGTRRPPAPGWRGGSGGVRATICWARWRCAGICSIRSPSSRAGPTPRGRCCPCWNSDRGSPGAARPGRGPTGPPGWLGPATRPPRSCPGGPARPWPWVERRLRQRCARACCGEPPPWEAPRRTPPKRWHV